MSVTRRPRPRAPLTALALFTAVTTAGLAAPVQASASAFAAAPAATRQLRDASGVTPIADQAELDAALAANSRVVVMFHATWCGACKQIAPKYAQFAAAYGTIKFLSVDVDDAEDVTFKYDISSMPTFVTIRDGKQMDRFSGANPDRLEEKLKALA